jgi:hypothetical protein
MSLYVRVDSSFWTHRKTLRLRTLIGESALWIPPRWWSYAANNQPDGDFGDYSDQELSMLLGYQGDAQALRQALLQAGFMDKDGKIHDWLEYNGYHSSFADRARKAARARWNGHASEKRREKKTVQEKRRDEPSNADACANAMLKHKPISREEVINFVKEIGMPESDGHYYFDKWEGNGYRNAGKPIKDWKAVIRSHKHAGYAPSQKQTGPSLFQRGRPPDPKEEKAAAEALDTKELREFYAKKGIKL